MGIRINFDGHPHKLRWASANHCNRTKIYFFPYIPATPYRRRLSGIRIRCKYVLTRKSKQQPPKRQRSSHKPLCKCLSYVSAFRSSVYEVFDFLGAKIILFFCILQKTRNTRGKPLRRALLNVISWALPKPTYFSYLDIRKVCKRTSRLDAPSRPAECARSLNVENSPSAQTVRRFSSLTFAQAGARLGA